MKKISLILIFAFLLILVAGCKNKVTGSTIANAEGYTQIPLSDLSEKIKFYEHDDNGVKIRYFAVLGTDRKPRTAFDACDVCGGYKGYKQEGNNIVCNNCGKTFSIDGLGIENKKYGCWPIHLSSETKDNNLLIKVDDIKKGRLKFTPKG